MGVVRGVSWALLSELVLIASLIGALRMQSWWPLAMFPALIAALLLIRLFFEPLQPLTREEVTDARDGRTAMLVAITVVVATVVVLNSLQ